ARFTENLVFVGFGNLRRAPILASIENVGRKRPGVGIKKKPSNEALSGWTRIECQPRLQIGEAQALGKQLRLQGLGFRQLRREVLRYKRPRGFNGGVDCPRVIRV